MEYSLFGLASYSRLNIVSYYQRRKGHYPVTHSVPPQFLFYPSTSLHRNPVRVELRISRTPRLNSKTVSTPKPTFSNRVSTLIFGTLLFYPPPDSWVESLLDVNISPSSPLGRFRTHVCRSRLPPISPSVQDLSSLL